MSNRLTRLVEDYILGLVRDKALPTTDLEIKALRATAAALEKEASALREEIERLKSRAETSIGHLRAEIFDSAKRTQGRGLPNGNPLAEVIRDCASVRWNSKLLGLTIAQRLYDEGRAGQKAALPLEPSRIGLVGKICEQADIESDWLKHWCRELGLAPLYHRKIWEYGFVLQALWENGMLEAGRRGLAFAVGNEPTPAFFASRGINVLATDLAQEDDRSAGWRNTSQHSASLKDLFRPNFLSEEDFYRLCEFKSVDMNAIPDDLHGKFDFCWSMCSFEHVGSIENGLEFVRNSVKCLKPGGIAAHTTEFNLESGDTIDNWATVLFQPSHIAELARRVAADGHEMFPVNYQAGTGMLDAFIDTPPFPHQAHPALPYPDAPHLRLNVDGFACTSIGVIIRARRST